MSQLGDKAHFPLADRPVEHDRVAAGSTLRIAHPGPDPSSNARCRRTCCTYRERVAGFRASGFDGLRARSLELCRVTAAQRARAAISIGPDEGIQTPSRGACGALQAALQIVLRVHSLVARDSARLRGGGAPRAPSARPTPSTGPHGILETLIPGLIHLAGYMMRPR